MIPDITKLTDRIAKADPSISIENFHVEGNVNGNIVVGNRNVIGDNNVIYEINTVFGTFIKPYIPQPNISKRPRNQPPHRPRAFVGREHELNTLEKHIRNKEAVLLYGHSGMGKTALLQQVANSEAANSMPDGVIYLEQLVEGGIVSPQDVLQRLFDRLFVSEPRIKLADPFKKAEPPKNALARLTSNFFRSKSPTTLDDPSLIEANLAATSPLILLDELDIEQEALSRLYRLFPAGALLVTSQKAELDGVFEAIHVPPLNRAEAIELFAQKANLYDAFPDTPATHPFINQICEILKDVPLAITILANAMRQNLTLLVTDDPPDNKLKIMVDRLGDHPPASQDDIQAAIERSLRVIYNKDGLRDSNPYISARFSLQLRLLMHAAAAPGKSVSREWLETEEGKDAKYKILDEIPDAEEGKAAKYQINGLVDLELLYENSPLRLPDGIRPILQLDTMNLAKELVESRQGLLSRHLLPALKKHYLDSNFVNDELGNILGYLQLAFREKNWSTVIELGRAVDPYLTLNGLWDAWGTALKQVQIAGRNSGDAKARAWALHQLGTREIGVGNRKQAIDLLRRALEIRLSIHDIVGAAYTLHNLRILFGLPPSDPDSKSQNEPDPPVSPPKPNLIDSLRAYWNEPRSSFAKYGLAIVAATLIALAAVSGVLAQPSLKLTEQANLTKYNHSGQVIEYDYMVDNPGFVPVPGPISVNDDPVKVKCPDLRNIGNGNTSLDWNERITCTGFYTVTDADIQNGSLPNKKKASTAGGDEKSHTESSSKSPEIPFDENYLTLTLQAQPETYTNLGQTITIAYIISNKGATTLNGPIKVTGDDQLQINCPELSNSDSSSTVLKAGEPITCIATYIVSETDIENGFVTSTASAIAGEINSETQSIAIYRIPQSAPNQIIPSDREPSSLILFQSADRRTYQAADEQVTYTYVVLNRGTAPMSGPVIVKADIHEVKCPDVMKAGNQNDVFDPGETITCTATYTITDADAKDGSITNTAVAYVGERNSAPQSVTIYSGVEPSNLNLSTFAKPETFQEVGQRIEHTYFVTNDGRYPLNGPVTVRDDKTTVNCPKLNTVGDGDDILDLGEGLTCTATYTITELDIQNGSVTHTARANMDGINSNPASSTVNEQVLHLAISANPETYQTTGDTITYTYTITSKSREPLGDPVTIAGNTIQARCQDVKDIGNGDLFLDWNETATCTSQYSITQADIDVAQPGSDRGAVTISAMANAGGIRSKQVSITLPGPVQQQALSLTIKADPMKFDSVDQKITYTYTITNEGNVTISSPLQVSDDHVDNGTPFTCGANNQFAPKTSATCMGSYTISQNDFGPKSVTNTATASLISREKSISATATNTLVCAYAEGWILYMVDPQESLDHIATWYPNTTIADLQKANCMGSIDSINVGQTFYIPVPPPSATISGFIRDTDGQPLNNTPVTLINSANGSSVTKYTSSNGEYIFSELGPSTYRIFQILITVRRGDTQTQNFTIIPGLP